MTKNKFRDIFLQVVEEISQETEAQLNMTISPNFEIQLHGAGYSSLSLSLDEVMDILYIDEERFYRIIDVSIIGVYANLTKIFVRVSAHKPGSFEQTWNTPIGYGPFKKLVTRQLAMDP